MKKNYKSRERIKKVKIKIKKMERKTKKMVERKTYEEMNKKK